MSEIVNTYDLVKFNSLVPMNRKDFYNEQIKVFKETWFPTKSVEVINIFLFNESWELILQKRSSSKGHNPNMIDKSIWWHVVNWDGADFTAMVESIQELKVPSLVLRNNNDFIKTYSLLKDYLISTAVIEYIDTKITKNTKLINKEDIVIANKTHFYMWVYWGSVKNVDKEAKWVLFYSLEELEQEMKDFPNMFTQDLHYYIREYKDLFINFINFIKEWKK